MNESNDPPPPNKHGCSIIRKAQIIGAVLGAAYAIGIHFYCVANTPHYMDFSFFFAAFSPIASNGDKSGDWSEFG